MLRYYIYIIFWQRNTNIDFIMFMPNKSYEHGRPEWWCINWFNNKMPEYFFHSKIDNKGSTLIIQILQFKPDYNPIIKFASSICLAVRFVVYASFWCTPQDRTTQCLSYTPLYDVRLRIVRRNVRRIRLSLMYASGSYDALFVVYASLW